MLNVAFKEWAAICRALAEGRQALILRKGGIAEPDGEFHIEHTRFWLFPTYVHQQRQGLQPAAWPLLDAAECERPPAGTVRLTHFAQVDGIYRVRELAPLLLLAHLHLWSEETVTRRFHYRVPELYVLVVRVLRAAEAHELPDTEYYQGCKSWIELERPLPTAGATAVLPEQALTDLHRQLDLLLNPRAFA